MRAAFAIQTSEAVNKLRPNGDYVSIRLLRWKTCPPKKKNRCPWKLQPVEQKRFGVLTGWTIRTCSDLYNLSR